MADEEELPVKDARQRMSLNELSIPHLPHCGFTCSVRTGSWIILLFYLIISVLYITGPLFRDRSLDYVSQVRDVGWSYPDRGEPLYIIDWLTIVVGFGTFIFSAIGLVAMYREDAKLLRPFLIWKLLQILFEAYWVVLLMFNVPFIFRVPFGIILVGLPCYMWLIVYSYHRDMINSDDEKEEPTPT